MDYLKAFLVGGLFCIIGQVLIDKTKLTPARILVAYVVSGVILGAVGVYKPLAEWAGAGATVPLTGFGYALAKGVKEAVAEKGLLGALTSPLATHLPLTNRSTWSPASLSRTTREPLENSRMSCTFRWVRPISTVTWRGTSIIRSRF